MKKLLLPLLIFSACASEAPNPQTIQNEMKDQIKATQAFDETMAAHWPRLSQCYRANIKDSEKEGSKEIIYVISTGHLGGVLEVTVQSSELDNPQVVECIRKSLLELTFPEDIDKDFWFRVYTHTL